jgi:hypothetical protein
VPAGESARKSTESFFITDMTNEPSFHCGLCHKEVANLSQHRRDMHPDFKFTSPSACEIAQCEKWRREHQS